MKQYKTYGNIRSRARIFGLPISLFGILIVAVVLSLLIIIFSFSLFVVISTVSLNILLFVLLGYIAKSPRLAIGSVTFPDVISNKKLSYLYEK